MQKSDEQLIKAFKFSEKQFSHTLLKQFIDPIVWKNDVGYLPGSMLKFRQDKTGVIQLHEDIASLQSASTVMANGFNDESGGQQKTEQVVDTTNNSSKSHRNGVNDNSRHGNGNGSCNSNSSNNASNNGNVGKKKEIPIRNGVKSPLNTSSYGRKRKRKILDGEVVGFPAKSRRERSDKDSSKSSMVRFDWIEYLKSVDSVGIPDTLFELFGISCLGSKASYNNNAHSIIPAKFKQNQKLEGIDPQNESLICVLTVAEVSGRRLRLHFDGYSEQFDFWVLADSQLIFPAGWCKENNRVLQPPKDYDTFEWFDYLARTKSTAAPKECFSIYHKPVSSLNNFPLGYKLEAVDKRNQCMICVATIQDVIGEHVLVHFDSWDSSYDMWAHCASPLLQPVGYCEENEKVLSVPASFGHDLSLFNWDSYLAQTNSLAVPKQCFSQRQQWWLNLEQGMRCEMVDRRCPQLIRVAYISRIDDEFQLTMAFDDWSDKYNIKVDLSFSWPVLLPIGWCNGHSLAGNSGAANSHAVSLKEHQLLQPPPTYDATIESSPCSVYGCKGYGHVKGSKYLNHQRISGCPYADCNLNKDLRSERIPPHSNQTHIININAANNTAHITNPTVVDVSTATLPIIDPITSTIEVPSEQTTQLQLHLQAQRQLSSSTSSSLAAATATETAIIATLPTSSSSAVVTSTASLESSARSFTQPIQHIQIQQNQQNQQHQLQQFSVTFNSGSVKPNSSPIIIFHNSNQPIPQQLMIDIPGDNCEPMDLSMKSATVDAFNHNATLGGNLNFINNDNNDNYTNGHDTDQHHSDVPIPLTTDYSTTCLSSKQTDILEESDLFDNPPGDFPPIKPNGYRFPSSLSLLEMQMDSKQALDSEQRVFVQSKPPRDLLPNPVALVPSSVLRPSLANPGEDDYCRVIESRMMLQILPQIAINGATSGSIGGISNATSSSTRVANSNGHATGNTKRNMSRVRRSGSRRRPNGFSAVKDEEEVQQTPLQHSKGSIYKWSSTDISEYVSGLIGSDQYSKNFIENEVDGSAFMCLKQIDLIKVIGMKLGPAIKVATSIQFLRQQEYSEHSAANGKLPISVIR